MRRRALAIGLLVGVGAGVVASVALFHRSSLHDGAAQPAPTIAMAPGPAELPRKRLPPLLTAPTLSASTLPKTVEEAAKRYPVISRRIEQDPVGERAWIEFKLAMMRELQDCAGERISTRGSITIGFVSVDDGKDERRVTQAITRPDQDESPFTPAETGLILKCLNHAVEARWTLPITAQEAHDVAAGEYEHPAKRYTMTQLSWPVTDDRLFQAPTR